MKREDTILVELPKAFPLARLASIAAEYGYTYRWSMHNDSMGTMRTPRHLEIVAAGTPVDRGEPSEARAEPDRGEPT